MPTRSNKPRYCWHIEGSDSLNKIYDKTVDAGLFTEKQFRGMLMALTAKAGLTNDEIVGAYAIKRTKLHNGLLDVKNGRLDVQKGVKQWMCGTNPHFVATLTLKD